MIITLRNQIGLIKQRKIGFSWTTFFFGWIVALARGDWKWMIIQLILGFITFGLSNLVFCFIYNKLHINDLLEKGFYPADENSRSMLVSKGFIVADKTLGM